VAACVVHREQASARVDDLLKTLVTHGHSHRELALVDGELASQGEKLVSQSFRSRVPELTGRPTEL
jgi:hypothetical protein